MDDTLQLHCGKCGANINEKLALPMSVDDFVKMKFICPECGSGNLYLGHEKTLIQLYEEKIGMLSPVLLDELKKMEAMYQRDWIEDAIGEAVKAGAHSLRYVSQVLASWKTKGYKAKRGSDGQIGQKGTVGGGVMDPARFKGQKYDNVVKR